MTFLKSTVAASALVLMAPMAMAVPILIDDFSVFQKVQDEPTPIGSVPFVPNTSMVAGIGDLGATRTLTVSTDPSNGTLPVGGSVLESTGVAGFPFPGTLGFSNENGQRGIATVTYTFAGPVDLTNGGKNTRLFFSNVDADLTGTTLETTVASTSGTDSFTEDLDASFSPFTNFSEFAGVDFMQVTSVTFQFDTGTITSFDGRFGSLSAVPLPASALLLLGGIGGLFGASAVSKRRRREEA